MDSGVPMTELMDTTPTEQRSSRGQDQRVRRADDEAASLRVGPLKFIPDVGGGLRLSTHVVPRPYLCTLELFYGIDRTL
jgi:hypothetical protein